jgi:hypothetical protein
MNKFFSHLAVSLITALLVFVSLNACGQDSTEVTLSFSRVVTVDGEQLLEPYATGTTTVPTPDDEYIYGTIDITYLNTGQTFMFAFDANDERIHVVTQDHVFTYYYSWHLANATDYIANGAQDHCTLITR